jgi:hypothetical protein
MHEARRNYVHVAQLDQTQLILGQTQLFPGQMQLFPGQMQLPAAWWNFSSKLSCDVH